MAGNIPNRTDLENMKRDIDDLANIVNSVEAQDVVTRLGKTHKSLTGRLDELQAQLDAKDATAATALSNMQTSVTAKEATAEADLATYKSKLARYAAVNYKGDFVADTAYEANDVWKNPADNTQWIVPVDYTSGATAQDDIDAKLVRPHQDRDRVEVVMSVEDLKNSVPAYERQIVMLDSGLLYESRSTTEAEDGIYVINTNSIYQWCLLGSSQSQSRLERNSSGIIYVGPGGKDAKLSEFPGHSGKRCYVGQFSDIATAISNSISGDLIVIKPGGYDAAFTLKAGVSVYAMPGVVLYNPLINATDINSIRFLGHAEIVVTDSNSTPIVLTDCDDYDFELERIRVVSKTNASRRGFKAVRCSGRILIRRSSYTNSNQILTFDNEWDDVARKTIVHHAGLYSHNETAAMSSNDKQLIGVFNGADVDVHSHGNIHSDFNNILSVGAITNPPSAKHTKCTLRGEAFTIDANGGFLLKGDSGELSSLTLDFEACCRIRVNEFARSGGTPDTNTKIRIFSNVHSNNEISAAGSFFGSVVVTPEA